MTSRSHTTDRELLLILITLLLLAFATHYSNAGDAEVALAKPATTAHTTAQTVAVTLDAAANPYWAPAHAFSRRLAPVYSDDNWPNSRP